MVTTSRILGANGEPIQLDSLNEPQTSKVMHLQHEWQGHPARGLTPSKLTSILLAAEQGDLIAQYELFEDMEERDGHILSEMGKRRRAVSGLDWDVVPPPNPTPEEEKAADTLKAILLNIEDIEGALFDTTDAIGKGFVCQEFDGWDRVDGYWMPKAIVHRPQSWFRLYRGFQQEVRLRDNTVDGAPLQPFGWITHTHKARSGYLERANIFRALVWPYLFKNYSVADLAEFLEIYGIPLRIGKYPPGAGEKEKMTLLRALVQVGHNAAGIIPDGMSLDFHDTADGDAAAFQLMMDWCERTVSKVILGATLTSQADRGSNTNALGNVHNEVRKELRDSDAKQIAASWSRDLVYPIAALNGLAPNGYRRCPRLRLDIAERADIKAYADALPNLVDAGLKISRKWVHEELGIPEAEDDDDTLVRSQPAANPPTDPAAVAAATAQRGRVAALAAAGAEKDAPARMVPQMERDAAPSVEAWVGKIRQLVEEVGSLEELRDRLLDLYPDMTLDQYAEAMAIGLGAARLAGRVGAQEQAGGNG
ncbi:MAG: DUF935 domain-containing protein [Stenotrophomonas sp.]|uniref:DUF935 domain-containing protein n=1 Tax=Stenotrophomonas sp. TaxID=69392 RepID=UPI001353E7CD|nr:DUF935 domain-containing protein [Stenotrophomonas sp.]MTI74717.1 DUF935 domain-containing protein [Stenotrophomonas sp.]